MLPLKIELWDWHRGGMAVSAVEEIALSVSKRAVYNSSSLARLELPAAHRELDSDSSSKHLRSA